MKTLERRLTKLEKAINLDPTDSREARVCVVPNGMSKKDAIQQHSERYGRMPVIVIAAKAPLDI